MPWTIRLSIQSIFLLSKYISPEEIAVRSPRYLENISIFLYLCNIPVLVRGFSFQMKQLLRYEVSIVTILNLILVQKLLILNAYGSINKFLKKINYWGECCYITVSGGLCLRCSINFHFCVKIWQIKRRNSEMFILVNISSLQLVHYAFCWMFYKK